MNDVHNHRDAVLDAWRAILIGAVLAFHFTIRYAPPLDANNLTGYDAVFSPNFVYGQFAVHIFFVISGIVITMTVLRSHDMMDFLFRRASRLLPAATLITVIVYGLNQTIGPQEFHNTPSDLVRSLMIIGQTGAGKFVSGSYWSLDFELQFYLLVAAFYIVFGKRFWIGILGVTLIGLWLAFFPLTGFEPPFVVRYMPFFLTGMAAWYGAFERRYGLAALLGMIGIIGVALFLPIAEQHPVPRQASMVIVLSGIFIMLGTIALKSRANLGPLPYLGRISYSLYLIHNNVGVMVIGYLKKTWAAPDLVAMAVAVITCIALAAAMFHFVERPCQAWLRKRYHAARPHLLPSPVLEAA